MSAGSRREPGAGKARVGAAVSQANGQRPGIAALKQIAGLNGKKITAGTVGFTLAPRINASGRLERADMAFRLLTTESPELKHGPWPRRSTM